MARDRKRKKKNQFRGNNYVNMLLSGRFQKKSLPNGKIVEEFVPMVMNPHPPLSQIRKMRPDLSEQQLLVKENLIQPSMTVDYKAFRKSDKQKALVKKIKNAHHKMLRAKGLNPKKVLNLSQPTVLRA